MVKILVVDDSRFLRASIIKFLKEKGYLEIFEAANEKQALDIFKKEKPDLVLLDIIMEKEKSGIEIFKKIKLVNPDVLVVVVSIVEETEVVGEAMRLGAKGYVNKPIDYNRLLSEIKKVLGR